MLMLKGTCGKSSVIDIIADRTNSVCLAYGYHRFVANKDRDSVDIIVLE